MRRFAVCPLNMAAAIAFAVSVAHAAKPYDAQVEYLDANATSGNGSVRPYIVTSLMPADNMGAHFRFAAKSNPDTVLFGTKTSASKTWYFGTSSKSYLSWMANPANDDRPSFLVNTQYDVFFNHLNDRDRRIASVDGASSITDNRTNELVSEYSLPITDEWSSTGTIYPIWIFNFNNLGSPYKNGGFYRVYSGQFTQGGVVVMDLIPVRIGTVGYLYDKVSGEFYGNSNTASTVEFAYGSDVADGAYVEGTVTLDSDADWTSRGMLRIDRDAVIDLNGHSLAIAGAFGDGTITDTSSDPSAPGELHVVVPERMDQTCSLALAGNLRVVKEGEGRLALVRSGQTFTGGVVVAAGTAYAPQGGYPESGSYWGPAGGTITVMSGATFDNKGNTKYASKQFVLDGGTLANSGSVMNSFNDGICHVRLTEDSYLDAESTIHLWGQAGTIDPHVDLGGHTLTVSIGVSLHLYLNTVVSNGTLVVEKGGYLHPSPKSGIVINRGSTTLDVRMMGGALNVGDDLPVRDYYAGYTNVYNSGTARLLVHGTFTPAAVNARGQECFYGCEMQDGSRIDLSAKSDTWNTTSTGFNGGSRTVSFADNARVVIDVHGRELAKGEQVVSWDVKPSNLDTLTFEWDAATVALGKTMFVTDGGIYCDISEADVAVAHWTGAANDNDVANPQNWACTNYIGGEVADGLPMGSTDVYVSGDIALQMTAASPLACNAIHFDNVRLTADCDWSGMKEWVSSSASAAISDLGSVDLNGYKLRLLSSPVVDHVYDAIRLAVTDTSSGAPGELHVAVPIANSYLECDGFTLSGNLKLVTEGPGWLAMAKAGQTFTGGVLVAEGTAYSPWNKCPESNGYWGPAGSTITILTNATFDARGNTNYCGKTFVLNGGTLANTDNMGASCLGFGNVTLVADSVFRSTSGKTTVFSAPNGTEKIDLGGHVLTVSLEGSCHLYLPVPVVNGTMEFRKVTSGSTGGYLHLLDGTEGGSSSVNLVMTNSAFYLDGSFSVSNYVARYGDNYNRGAAHLKVYGTFTPAAVQASGTERFRGCEMQDGSAIDLSAKTNAWSSVAQGYTGTSFVEGNRTTTFADGATVDILLGTRRLTKEERVIDWSAATPANRAGLKFCGVFSDGRRANLVVRDDGVYFPARGLLVMFE